ncbi:MAG: DUF1045 domain-containing protein [Paracoccaceae bacterium]
MNYRRYAVYYTPPPGALATFGADWLGWDARAGTARPHPPLLDLPRPAAEITETPRRYGFHATIKPPFRLAPDRSAEDLAWALDTFCQHRPSAGAAGLTARRLGRFLALVPEDDGAALSDLAGAAVEAFDTFRAPPEESDLARRRKAGLTPRQEALLTRWGYPYVMEEFRFHMTLTGRLSAEELDAVEAALGPALAECLPRPFTLDALSLMGEDESGRFHEIHRYPLDGMSAAPSD